MKIYKLLFIFSFLAVLVPSCVEDTAPEDAYGQSPNLASFVNESAINLSGVASGEEYDFEIPMRVKGPSLAGVTENVTATIEVVPFPATTAVEGTHFRLDQTTVTFTPEGDLVGQLPITMLTEGIDAPLKDDEGNDYVPVIVLRVSSVSGASNVIANGKTLTINLLYLCFSDLAGNYEVHMHRVNPDNSSVDYVWDEVITKTADGEYRGTIVGHYGPPPNALGGEPGFDFVDVCDVITVPLQNLVNLYSNEVYGIGESYVEENGDLHIEYEITFAAGNRKYYVDYIKQ